MMGRDELPQGKLFYYDFNLEKRVRWNHPLRKIKSLIDFDFVYDEVKAKYGGNGNVSVPPPVILKLMLLLVIYNVRSERELMITLQERLDWLWFLGYDLDTEAPNHSVLSKARRRWGVEVFKKFFENIVSQCVEAGLVDGSKIFMDSSLIDADASNNSVVDMHSLNRYLKKSYKELENRLEEKEESRDKDKDKREVNNRYISTTDSDASLVNRGGKSKLRYQSHRAVDGAYEIITSSEVTAGDVNEAHRMCNLLDSHHENTGKAAGTVVADSKYGTIENYLHCSSRGLKPHFPDLRKKQDNKGSRAGIFPEAMFVYDKEKDRYLCPSGKTLKRKSLHIKRQSIDYSGSRKQCGACDLMSKCTRNKSGRTIKRHLRQDELDSMRRMSQTQLSRRDIKTRFHLMERSFARAKRYGYKRARWRGLWRVQIQEFLTAAIQNIETLIRRGTKPKNSIAATTLAKKYRGNLLIMKLCPINYSYI